MFPLRLPAEERALDAVRRELLRIARRLESVTRPLAPPRPVFVRHGRGRPALRLLRGGRALD